jgi:hypothetical protein
MSIDVARNIVSPFHMTGDKKVENAFTSQSGIYASAVEHMVFEWMFNVNAVSAVKILQQANKLSLPVFNVTSQNIGQVLPLLQIPNSVQTEIQNAVNAGLIVIVPQTEVTLNSWTGIGYIVQNPENLTGAYKISGGINGGSSTGGIFCYTCGCSGAGDWARLLDDIDALLSLANALLAGNVNLQGLANELCVLLQGIRSDVGAALAENILIQFRKDVVLMVVLTTMLPWGSPDLPIVTVIGEIAMHLYGFEGDILQYVGYFTIHYLYEYVVLFNAGLLDAFQGF